MMFGLKRVNSAKDVYAGYNFVVAIAGKHVFADFGFKSVSGLKKSISMNSYREGGDPNTPRQIAGITSYEPIVLTRGLSADGDATAAFDKLANSAQEDAVLTMTISLKNRMGTVVREYHVPRCWLNEFEHGSFDADNEEVVIETMTFTHEGFSSTTK